MYLPTILVVAWGVVTFGTIYFAYETRRAHDRNRASLRKAQRHLQKIESKNGKLWYEVMKTRASGDLYAKEITVTNVEAS